MEGGGGKIRRPNFNVVSAGGAEQPELSDRREVSETSRDTEPRSANKIWHRKVGCPIGRIASSI